MNLTISIVAVVSMRSLPTMKFNAVALGFASGEPGDKWDEAVAIAPVGSVALSRNGPLSFSFLTCKRRTMKNCWLAPAI